MTTLAPELLSERQSLEAALVSNPNDFASHIKLAQLEAKVWMTDPGQADLSRIVRHLDFALATLPAEMHPRITQFIQQLHQQGVGLGPIIKGGDYPRLLALLTGQPVPQGPAVRPAPAAPAPAPPSPSRPPAAPAANGRTQVRDIEVGEVTNNKIKEWMAANRIEELANAYADIDNFRTRRVVIEKVAENPSPLSVACLVRMLTNTHDEALANDIVKRLCGFDKNMVAGELFYDANNPKTKLAVVRVMAAIKTENCVEPLTVALNDRDSHVRALAVEGLADMLEPDPEWLEHLATMVKKDQDLDVKTAAAKALQSIGTKESLAALEGAARAPGFDDSLRPILEALSLKVKGGGKAAADKKKAQAAADKKKTQAKDDDEKAGGMGQLIMMGGVLLISVIGIGWWAYGQYKSALSREIEKGPQREVPAAVDVKKTASQNFTEMFMKNADPETQRKIRANARTPAASPTPAP